MVLMLYLVLSNLIFAQNDWKKWDAKNISYTLPSLGSESKVKTASNDFVSISQKAYKNLFSNLDGDNCAFYPSCSSFFVKAVHKTNFVKGTLLFVDRFTRDLNYVKIFNNYPLYKNGHFYDPVEKYINISSD